MRTGCDFQARTCYLQALTARLENWGTKILTAVENQSQLLSEIAQASKNGLPQPFTSSSRLSGADGNDLETLSRKDTPWTPITGSDMILNWLVFPREKPVSTFPASEYGEKEKFYDLGMPFMP